jgi:pyruvate dehydrogenase E2 component (dihydrolipoamide acetyltransferase)
MLRRERMATAIIMPKAGMAMEEGTVMKWLKAEGDAVEQGEPLLEILTDKVVMEVEAQVSGTLIKILKEEGEVVPVTKTIGYLGEAGEKAPEAEAVKEAAETAGTPEAAIAKIAAGEGEKAEEKKAANANSSIDTPAVRADGKVAATPAAKRIAVEKGIDLLKVKGSGENGVVKARDVEAHKEMSISPLARRAAEAEGIDVTELRGSGHAGKILMQDVEGKLQEAAGASAAVNAQEAGTKGAGTPEAGQLTADGKEIAEVIPYSGVRKVIGQRMVESKFTAPHVYFTQKVDLEKLLDTRKTVNESQEKKTSVTDYIAKAVIKAMKKYPDFNQSLMGDKIVRYKRVNLGIAVAAPGGLIVPVIKDADDKSVMELSKEAGVLFEKARTGKLKPDEYQGGTFTISNLGMFGIENFTAIINQPEVGILAVSATKDEPVVVKDESGSKSIQIKPMMNITLTVDHRVIDGLLAAQFVTEVKRLLENPIELLI